MGLGGGRPLSPLGGNPLPLLDILWFSIARLGHFWSTEVIDPPLPGKHPRSVFTTWFGTIKNPMRGSIKKSRLHCIFWSRFSQRVNNTDMFHVDKRFWTSLRSRFPGPRERAFHTATVIGNYMVVFGEIWKTKNKTKNLADAIHSNKLEFIMYYITLFFFFPFLSPLRWKHTYSPQRGEVLR